MLIEVTNRDNSKSIMKHHTTLDRLMDGSDPMDYPNVKVIDKRQFTGRKDKNGVEIYESNRLICSAGMEWVVSFVKGCFVAHDPEDVKKSAFLYDYDLEVMCDIHQEGEQ